LIKLKSDDLSQIERVFVNLGINEIILYHEDKEIAEKLIDSGFSAILIK